MENLALRQQLAVLNRKSSRPKLRRMDRVFWVILSKIFGNWKSTLPIVQPATVIRWHRQCFKHYWRWKSRKNSSPSVHSFHEFIEIHRDSLQRHDPTGAYVTGTDYIFPPDKSTWLVRLPEIPCLAECLQPKGTRVTFELHSPGVVFESDRFLRLVTNDGEVTEQKILGTFAAHTIPIPALVFFESRMRTRSRAKFYCRVERVESFSAGGILQVSTPPYGSSSPSTSMASPPSATSISWSIPESKRSSFSLNRGKTAETTF